MIATLAAALSLAGSLAIEVPYLPQTDALCGGAAAAMVFRYWGDAHASADEFAPLVDRRAGGIANGVLVDAVRRRGWRVAQIDGSIDALKARLSDGQPVIVLVPDRGRLYHYVVVTGATSDAIVLHDPSWGPSRTIRVPEFEKAWGAARFWSLVILPPAAVASAPANLPAPPTAAEPTAADSCDAALDRAVSQIRARGFEQADALLGAIRAQCPDSSGPLRELSAVRFAQRRWHDAAALARDALMRDPRDEYALDVLGSSLFMMDESVGALRAWNQIGKPRVNLVRINGLSRTRYQAVAEALAIRPNALLTADMFERARRRLGELPDQTTARLAIRPEDDGFASVEIAVAERATLPRSATEWMGAALRAGIDRELGVTFPGTTGQGDVWSASWSWWSNRPSLSVGFAAPRVHGLPGVWRVNGMWQVERFAADALRPRASLVRESRLRGALSMSDWLSGSVRYALSTGFDSWNGGRKAASIGASIERRLFRDKLSVAADASRWLPLTGDAAFSAAGVRASAQSSTEIRRWRYLGGIGVEHVSDVAPLGLWPGAGDGHARAPLLRAHPLLHDGIVDLTGSSAFGRSLEYGNVEGQRWLERPSLVRVGVAGFADVARATRRADARREPAQVDIGGGLRVKIPGSAGVLRVDYARGVRDGASALTFGWLLASRGNHDASR